MRDEVAYAIVETEMCCESMEHDRVKREGLASVAGVVAYAADALDEKWVASMDAGQAELEAVRLAEE